MLDIYYNSVGNNATLLLNIPPNKQGLIDKKDAEVLKQMGDYLKHTFKQNIVCNAKIDVDFIDDSTNIYNITKEDDDKFYKGIDNNEKATITFNFDNTQNIKTVVLKEHLPLSQRIEQFEIYAKIDNHFVKVFDGNVVGSRKICKLNNVNTNCLQIKILKSRVCPTLNFVGIYI